MAGRVKKGRTPARPRPQPAEQQPRGRVRLISSTRDRAVVEVELPDQEGQPTDG